MDKERCSKCGRVAQLMLRGPLARDYCMDCIEDYMTCVMCRQKCDKGGCLNIRRTTRVDYRDDFWGPKHSTVEYAPWWTKTVKKEEFDTL